MAENKTGAAAPTKVNPRVEAARVAGSLEGTAFEAQHEESQVTDVVLAKGETVLASMREASTDKTLVVLEIAEGKLNPRKESDALSQLMSGHESFGPMVSIRRGWITALKTNLKQLGITDEQIDKARGEVIVPLGIKNPKLNGKRLVVQSVDGLEAFTPDQEEYPEKRAKKVGTSTGVKYFHKGGKPIFQKRATIVIGEENRKDVIIESDLPLLTWEQLQDAQATAASKEEALNG